MNLSRLPGLVLIFFALNAGAFYPTSEYTPREIDGWKILVHQAALKDHPKETGDAMELLRVQLYQIKRRLPEKAVASLRKVTIWVEWQATGNPCMCYHPSREWLTAHDFNPEKAGGVEIANIQNFLKWTIEQPWMVLHEMAHAYHHQVLGHQHAGIRDAYQAAVREGRYDNVPYILGGSKKHYALNNDQEYFAEGTEAYFGTNDFYPFVRRELKEHDPKLFEVLHQAWGD